MEACCASSFLWICRCRRSWVCWTCFCLVSMSISCVTGGYPEGLADLLDLFFELQDLGEHAARFRLFLRHDCLVDVLSDFFRASRVVLVLGDFVLQHLRFEGVQVVVVFGGCVHSFYRPSFADRQQVPWLLRDGVCADLWAWRSLLCFEAGPRRLGKSGRGRLCRGICWRSCFGSRNMVVLQNRNRFLGGWTGRGSEGASLNHRS